MIRFFINAVRDARNDPIFPAAWWVAPFWVVRHWFWLRQLYREIDR